MRVHILSYSDSKGGAAIAARRMADAIRRFPQVTLSFFAIHVKHPGTIRLLSGHTRIYFYFLNLLSFCYLEYRFGHRKIKKSLNMFSISGRRSMVTSGADILHLHWCHNETYSLDEMLRTDIPMVITLHDSWFFEGVFHWPDEERAGAKSVETIEALKSRVASKKDVVFTVPASWGLRKMHSMYGEEIACKVVPNPVDLTVFSPQRTEFEPVSDRKIRILLCISTHSKDKNKGVDLFHEALQKISEHGVEVHRVGYFEEDWTLEGCQVIDHGFVRSATEMSRLYSHVDLVAVPSRFEMFGQAAAEAIACGTPVVCFRVGGLSDVVENDVSGKLVEPYDVSAFASAMVEVAKGDIGRREWQDNCRAMAKRRFDMESIGSRLMEVYQSVLKQSPADADG